MSQANVQVVELADGRRVCLSYGVVVAAFIPRGWEPTVAKPNEASAFASLPSGYVRTEKRYSVTTSKHASMFAGRDSPRIPHAELLALCAPVQSRL